MDHFENTQETVFWPPKIIYKDVLLNSFWSFIAWVIWSISLLIMVFTVSGFVDIQGNFNSKIWVATNMLFPFLMSLLALISWIITSISTYKFLNLLSKDKYKETSIHMTQIAIFSIIVYAFLWPAYIFTWIIDYNNIMYMFMFHMIMLTFWLSVIIEIMNNYRYVLTWIYGSFIAVFITVLFTIWLFSIFSWWFAKLMVLLFLFPLLNFLTTLIKESFQYLYFKYYKLTSLDPLWDIFSRIEDEENELLRKEEEENQLY